MTWSCVGIAVAVYRLSARATRAMDGGRLMQTKIPCFRRDIHVTVAPETGTFEDTVLGNRETLCFVDVNWTEVAKGGNVKRSSFKIWSIKISDLTFICPCIANIIPNYNQQDAIYLDLFISTDTVHVSGGSSAHHQEHTTVHTASGIFTNTAAYCYHGWDDSSISSTIAASSVNVWQYQKLYVKLCAPDDGRKNRLKHVERL